MTESMTTGRKLEKGARVMNAFPVFEFMKLEGKKEFKLLRRCNPWRHDKTILKASGGVAIAGEFVREMLTNNTLMESCWPFQF
jgi:hypothetical protein